MRGRFGLFVLPNRPARRENAAMFPFLQGLDPFSLCLFVSGGTLLGVLGLLAEGTCRRGALRWAPPALLLLLLLLPLAEEWLFPISRPALTALAGVCAALYLLRTPLAGRLASRLCSGVKNPRLQWGGLLVACLALVPVANDHLNPVSPDWQDFLDPYRVEVDPSQFRAAPDQRAFTDRGRPIGLFVLSSPRALTFEDHLKAEAAFLNRMTEKWQVLRLAPPDRTANCHGWAFAGGQFWVAGRDVEAILQDNGYQLVSDPRPNDLAIYRDDERQIVHSGVVQGLAGNGVVLIEGKWGWAGRYLHPAACQMYGARVTFYRSDRGSHSLRIEALPAAGEGKKAI
jgi:hypothetical protein